MGQHRFMKAWLLGSIIPLVAAQLTTLSVPGGAITTSLASLTAPEPPSLPTQCTVNFAPAAPKQKVLSRVRTTTVNVTKNPFGLAFVNDDVAVVSLVGTTVSNSTLGVLDTRQFAPRLIHELSLPLGFVKTEGVTGISLTHDRRHVLVTAGPGAVIFDTAKAIAGRPDAIIGTLNDTTPASGLTGPGSGAIQATLSSDDEYAFISQEYGTFQIGLQGDVDVFKLHESRNGSITSTQVGYLTLGYEVVGTVLSPDGRTLYATSEGATYASNTEGLVSVLDVATLQTNPNKALVSRVGAACSPVRAIISCDGNTLWVTARESDLLLAFDTAKLVTKPSKALIAKVTVGTAPIGLTFARGESRIVTADSNRFRNPNATAGLTVVDVEKALAGKPANLGRIPTGLFPRELAISPNGKTVLVADNGSGQVQAIDVDSLP